MKTNIFILIFTLCTFSRIAYSQEIIKRPVIWIKGFTSEEEGGPGWQRYDTLFSRQFYMKGFRPTYLSNKPIAAIASIFRTQTLDNFNLTRTLPYDTLFSDISTSILIGHSMGGLVARAWEQLNRLQNRSPEIGGIITVAAPNQGSIANRAAKDGLLFDVVNRATNLLTEPFTTVMMNNQILTLPFDLTSVFPASTLLSAIEGLKNTLNTTVAGVIKRTDPFISPFDDMIPNSSFLDSLNAPNQTGNIPPIINIQCVANSPSIYRVAVSFLPFGNPHDAETDKYNDDFVIKATDILAATALAGYSAILPFHTEILAKPTDTLNAKLARDPMFLFALAASKTEFAALRTWRSIKYDLPVSVSVLLGSAQFSYLPYSQSTQYIRRSEENGVTDGKYLFRYVTSQEGEVVPTYLVKSVINYTDSTGQARQDITWMGDDGTLSEDVQEQPYNRLRTERVVGVTHVSVQNNQNIRLRLLQIFRQPNSPFSIPEKQ